MFLYLGGRFVQALRRAFFQFFNSSIITFAIPRCPDKIGVRTFCEGAENLDVLSQGSTKADHCSF